LKKARVQAEPGEKVDLALVELFEDLKHEVAQISYDQIPRSDQREQIGRRPLIVAGEA